MLLCQELLEEVENMVLSVPVIVGSREKGTMR